MQYFAGSAKRFLSPKIYEGLRRQAWLAIQAFARIRFQLRRKLGSARDRLAVEKVTESAAKRAGHQRAELAQRYARELPLEENHVMYESYNGRDFAGNPYALFRYLLDHPDYGHLTHIISLNEADNAKANRFRDHPRVKVVEVHSDEFIRHLETAKYQINDASFKDYTIKREGQVYVHGWHSTLLKKLAGDAGRPWEAVRVNRALLQTDFFISPNRFTTDVLLDSHGVTPFYKGEIAEFGYPRNDLTVNVDKEAIRQRLNIPAGKKVALYAPTWRGNYRPENTVAQTLEYWAQLRASLPRSYVLVVKFHTMVYGFMSPEDRAACVPDDLDINEVLGATDLLITDYSGIFYDYLVTGNPVVYYTPDLDEYMAQKNGLYLDLEALPGPICRSPDDVGRAVRQMARTSARYAERYQDFVSRFVADDDGGACKRTVDLVFHGVRDDRVRRIENHKKNVVIYPANLAQNGVTVSFLALLENIDYDAFNVAVLLPDDRKYREVQAKINKRAGIFYLHTEYGFTPAERRRFDDAMNHGISDPDQLPLEAIKAVVRRTFGDLAFDCAINFSGYFPQAASILRFGVNAKRHVIYLHNDLDKDRQIKHPQLHSVFSMYRFHDDMICVSKKSQEANNRKIGRYVRFNFGFPLPHKMRFSMNSIVPNEIRDRAMEKPRIVAYGERKFALVQQGPMNVGGFPWPQKGNVNFIAIGRLSPEKNHRRLIYAFQQVVAEHDNAFLYIVGDGILAPDLKALIERLQLKDKVIMTGSLPNPLALLRACSCLVSSSDIEGQPITILEALVLGKPIIATKIAGHMDMLARFPRCLTPRSVVGMAPHLKRFMTSPRRYRTSFNAEKYATLAMTQFYRKVVRATPRPPE